MLLAIDQQLGNKRAMQSWFTSLSYTNPSEWFDYCQEEIIHLSIDSQHNCSQKMPLASTNAIVFVINDLISLGRIIAFVFLTYQFGDWATCW